MSNAFISIRNVRKTFGAVVAVDDVNLEIPRGELLTFLGPSGSGKSTTLYCLAGFQEPNQGDILLEGKSVLDIPSHKRNIGMVFQRYTLFPHLSVADNIGFPLRVRRQSSAVIDAKVTEMLALVRMSELRDRLPAQLSGGQQQRVALARALAYDPPVLLMDEPLSALDKKLRDELQTEIRRIHQQTGVTILYVTHDQEEALRLSDRIAVFNHGRIVQIGSGEELYRNPSSRFVAGFIGNSNFLEARITKTDGPLGQVVFADGTVVGKLPIEGSIRTGDAASVMIRPENITLGRDDDAGSPGLRITIRDLTFLGDNIHVLGQTEWGQQVDIRAPIATGGAQGLVVGDAARIGWSAEQSHVFSTA